MALPNNLVYPKANLRLLNAAYRPSLKLAVLNRVNFHSTASQATSQFAYFNSSGKASSHLHLDKAGNWEQYQYLDLRSEADLEGNDATWSVETQGVATGDEPWTEAQVRELAEFFRWARGYGVLNQLATSSASGSNASKGLSWHRLGIDGNFPALPSIQAGRLQRGGGMHYSAATGKVCPGYMRIDQIPRIFALSQDAPAPTPITLEDDMKIIFATNRGYAIIGPGYYHGIANNAEIQALQKIWGPGVGLTNEEFDLNSAAAIGAGNTVVSPVYAASTWNNIFPKIEGDGSSAGPATAQDFVRSTALNTEQIKVKPAADVDEAALATAIANAVIASIEAAGVNISAEEKTAIANESAAKTVALMPKTLS